MVWGKFLRMKRRAESNDRFPCKICGETLSRRDNLQRHRNTKKCKNAGHIRIQKTNDAPVHLVEDTWSIGASGGDEEIAFTLTVVFWRNLV